MLKSEKQHLIDQLHTVFEKNSAVLLLDFTGINVADETELRGQISPFGNYRVVKNTLALRAAQDTPLEDVVDHFQGPTALAFSETDPVGLAKVLTGFLKTHPSMSFKAGVMDHKALTAEEVKRLAELPSRDVLLAKLVYLLQSPLTHLASALQSPVRSLVAVLTQIEAKKD